MEPATPANDALSIKRWMNGAQVTDVVTELRASNPSKAVETDVFVDFIHWFVHNDIRLNQYSHLIHNFRGDNIENSVLFLAFRRFPALIENENAITFYKTALEFKVFKQVYGNDMARVRESIRKELEEMPEVFNF